MDSSELDEKLLEEFEEFDISDIEIDEGIEPKKLKKIAKKILNYEVNGIGKEVYADYERILEEVLGR